jgi:hypothetical protein
MFLKFCFTVFAVCMLIMLGTSRVYWLLTRPAITKVQSTFMVANTETSATFPRLRLFVLLFGGLTP